MHVTPDKERKKKSCDCPREGGVANSGEGHTQNTQVRMRERSCLGKIFGSAIGQAMRTTWSVAGTPGRALSIWRHLKLLKKKYAYALETYY